MWWMMVLLTAALLNGVSCHSYSHTHGHGGKVPASHPPSVPPIPCEEARFKCAQREGCGMALENYLTGCSAVLHGYPFEYCPEICQNSLIALTSTEEGKALMTCTCSDDLCDDTKQRVEICRPQVMIANMNETVVNCHVAQMICFADPACSKALEYYDHYCKAMFVGKKCTSRCRNSINILRRQEKSAKLRTCRCVGRDSVNCTKIQKNMAHLCYHKKVVHETNEVLAEAEQKSNKATVDALKVNYMILFVVVLLLT